MLLWMFSLNYWVCDTVSAICSPPVRNVLCLLQNQKKYSDPLLSSNTLLLLKSSNTTVLKFSITCKSPAWKIFWKKFFSFVKVKYRCITSKMCLKQVIVLITHHIILSEWTPPNKHFFSEGGGHTEEVDLTFCFIIFSSASTRCSSVEFLMLNCILKHLQAS